jgi:UDP-2,3-diacylglucosamine pyrophosphatase LpxH
MLRVASDLHIATGQPYHWAQQHDIDRQVRFFYQTPADCDVVLDGDVFDGWVFPYNVKPPTFPEILSHPFGQSSVEAMHRLGSRLTVVPGNHDQLLDAHLLASILPAARFSPEVLTVGQATISHGHLPAVFNAADPSQPFNLPLGYHLSRLSAYSGGPSIGQQLALLVKIPVEGLPDALIDTMRRRAGLGWNARILMPDDLGGGSMSLSEVRDRYHDLTGRWGRSRGVVATIEGLPAELGHLELAADQLFLAGAKVVVFGHTHQACIQRTLGRTYANAGAWCCGQGSWVEIDDQGVVQLRSA